MKRKLWLHFLLVVICQASFNIEANAVFFDAFFGAGGIHIVNSGSYLYGRFDAVAVQADGKLLAAGSLGQTAVVMRFKENGTPDSSFGSYGRYYGAPGSMFHDVVIQPDGKIVAVGNIMDPTQKFLVTRLLADGTTDGAFGSGGIVISNFGSGSCGATAVGMTVSGKIIVAGTYGAKAAFLRLHVDGSLDNTFGSLGKFAAVDGDIRDIEVATDGRIFAAGNYYPGTEFLVMCVAASGDMLDPSFNSIGLVHTPVGSTWSLCNAVKLLADGSILAGGSGYFGTEGSNFAIVKYTSTGMLDASFGIAGIAQLDFNGNDDRLWDMRITADGKILVAGGASGSPGNEDIGVARFSMSGILDNTFGLLGKVRASLRGGSDKCLGMDLQADGKIVLAGATFNTATTTYDDAFISRMLAEPTAVNDLKQLMNESAFFPNPASETAWISNEIAHHIVSLTVADMVGRKQPCSLSGNAIDVSFLREGAYLVTYLLDGGAVKTEIITIRR